MRGPARFATWPRLALLAAIVARLAWLVPRLRYPDLLVDYPFPGIDGVNWVSNGLALAGYPVRGDGRTPLLPAVLAGLEHLHALSWFPLLHQLVPVAGAVALYVAVARWHGERVALLAALLPLVSSAATTISLELMADTTASVLFFLSLLALLRARADGRWYVAAGALAGLSGLCQQAALLWAPCVALLVLVYRRAALRDWRLWAGAAVFVLTTGAQGVATALVAYHGAATNGGVQWTLLGFHTNDVPFYLACAVEILGLPFLVLAILGARRAIATERGLLFTSAALLFTAFFVFFYTFRDHRFVLYGMLPAAALAAEALAAIRRRSLQAAVACGGLLWAASPTPGVEVGYEARAAVVPFAWYLDATTLPPTLLRPRWGEVWNASPWRRVVTARSRRPPGPPLAGLAVPPATPVLYLHGTDEPGRYDTIEILGGTLRTRVRWLPQELLPPTWPGWRQRRSLGIHGGYAVFSVASPCDGAATLVVFAAKNPVWRDFASAAGGAPGEARAWQAACETGRQVQRLAGPGDPFVTVALLPRPPLWQQVLPFALRTSNLYQFPPAEQPYVCGQLGQGGAALQWANEQVGIVRGRISRRGTLVVLAKDPRQCPGVLLGEGAGISQPDLPL